MNRERSLRTQKGRVEEWAISQFPKGAPPILGRPLAVPRGGTHQEDNVGLEDGKLSPCEVPV